MIGELEQFIGAARWFGGKGRTHSVADVRRAGTLGGPPAADAPTVGIELVTLEYPGSSSDDAVETEVYQVPLAYYLEPQERLEHAYVGTWEDPELGQVHAYDALHDRSATALWLQAFAEGNRRATGSPSTGCPATSSTSPSTRRCSPASRATPRSPSARTA